MDQSWGTRTSEPPEPESGQLQSAHKWLLGAAVITTVAIIAYLVDYTTSWRLHKAAYAGLAVLSLLCWCGWIIRSAESQVRREFTSQVAELTAVLREVLDEPRLGQVAHLPSAASRREAVGSLSAAVGGQGAYGRGRIGLDPESIAAARTIAAQLLDRPPTADRDDSR
ncbi:hypothetical protein AB0C02_28280 [Micromonospora sp. NPDC048999]|uniref:hypothetical protein n=1 Tax=Micromonospora sp. NPDC048999 TaxID=3155391 RepID=UPI0033D35098